MKFIKDVYWRIRNSTELVYCKLDYKDMSKFRLWVANVLFFLMLFILDSSQSAFEEEIIEFYYEDKTQW